MNADLLLSQHISSIVNTLYQLQSKPSDIVLQKTKKEFEGDITLVVFPFTRASKTGPEQTAQQIGEALKQACSEISAFNVVKGFLNISLTDAFWMGELATMSGDSQYGLKPANSSGKAIMLEYSSPNTNKPLHLGHVRNNLLGYSVAELLKSQGHRVIKANLVNDRGIHICKSMLAWKKFGNGENPQSSGMKGDHLVGKYYVAFDKAYKQQVEELVQKGHPKEEAEKQAPLMLEIQDMLRKWEAGDPETIELWKMMNGWVYEGFAQTYKNLGVDFDKMYYESNTYLLGKELVQDGLAKGVFYKKDDGSVRIDLSKEGLDEKVVLRSDGTSVYITQDLGTAIERFNEFPELSQLIYTVGNEQDYHFKVLFKILEKLGYAWAKECYHLSYGMVELPEGKMKSREGTVVDADDLVDEMIREAGQITNQKIEESGKTNEFSAEELSQLFHTVGLGALKYFILKVDPKKKMLFDPKESIDFNGNTGPFIQYTHARIRSILRKYEGTIDLQSIRQIRLEPKERELIKTLYEFPAILQEAANAYNPGLAANYTYELVKLYNQFYHDCPVLKAEDPHVKILRIQLSLLTGDVIKTAMGTLGIQVPDRM